MNQRERLAENFESLQFPAEASAWLLELWDVVQGFDDLADGDPVDDVDGLIWGALVGLQSQGFFLQNGAALLPLMANAFLKWKTADTVERRGEQLPKAYMWRAGYYDIVLQVALLVHGWRTAMKLGPDIMGLYGETLSDYLKEFEHA